MNSVLRSLVVLVVFELFALPALCLDPYKGLGQYVYRTWGIDQGLPQSTVFAVSQSNDGYLWVATQEGYARFDGSEFEIFDKTRAAEIRNNLVLTLLAARDGSLWVGTNDGLIRHKTQGIEVFTSKEGLPSSAIHVLLESRDGSLWIGTRSGLSRFAGGKIVPFSTSIKLPHPVVTALAEDHTGRLWIGTLGGLLTYKDGQLAAPPAGIPSDHILGLYTSQDGTMWIGTNENGLYAYRFGRLLHYGPAEGLPSSQINVVFEDKSGTMWIGTVDRGVGRFREGRFDFPAGEPSLLGGISSFVEDREGNLWVGASSGLTRISQGDVMPFSASEGLADDAVFALSGDSSGRLWVATGKALQVLNGSQFAPSRDWGIENILTSWVARDGTVWIGTMDRGLYGISGEKRIQFREEDGLGSDTVLSLFEGRDGTLWVGTARGLKRVINRKLEPGSTGGSFSGEAVSVIFEDRKGTLWAGTQDGGLNRIVNGAVTSFTTANGLASDTVLALHEDRRGTMWIGTAGAGLSRYRDGRFSSINTRQGLYDDNVMAILEDGSENLWMSCNKGIFRVSLNELNAAANGSNERVRSIGYGLADGMKSRECMGGTQPVAWKTPDGRLWFATTRGVAMINPDDLRTEERAAPVLIQDVLADRNRIEPNGKTKLPPGTKTLEFRYTGFHFRAPEQLRYQYRLEGFDSRWIDAAGRRVAYYTSLPPGEYQFQVRASTDGKRWSNAPAVTSFSLQPFFYQTPTFWIASAFSIIALSWGAHRSRVRLIRASAERFKLLFDRNLAGVYRAGADGKILECNDALARILGFESRAALIGRNIFDQHWRGEEGQLLLRRLREFGSVSNRETSLRRQDGEQTWVLENITLVRNGSESLEATLIDITDRRRAEDQIRYQAFHDALTGLPNRMLFKDRLTLALAQAHRNGSRVAVLFLDLDRFKLINDTFGHTVGDDLLRGIGERLKTCVRENDSVSRAGGDEFTLMLTDLGDISAVGTVARKILDAVARPITVDGHEMFVTTSIGISIYPTDGEDAETLLKDADSAMYRAKDAGRNSYQLCTPSLARKAADRLSLENALRQAIDRDEFLLHYQPQMDLRTTQIRAVEALLRWDRPGKGIVRPGEFIPAAEESRLILQIGEMVLHRACQQATAWAAIGYPLRVSVNVSANQFQQHRLVQTIKEALSRSGMEPSLLEIEITESTAMQAPDLTAEILAELKRLGISVMIDDFGVGHSSLNYLKRFPIDGLKIDRTFVSGIPHDESDTAIASAVVAMAHALKLRVVAEGVETEEQLSFLESRGCREFQGYLVSRPLPVSALTQFLDSGPLPRAPQGRRPSAIFQPSAQTDH